MVGRKMRSVRLLMRLGVMTRYAKSLHVGAVVRTPVGAPSWLSESSLKPSFAAVPFCNHVAVKTAREVDCQFKYC